MKNAISWFEIPVKDYERAKTFYSSVTGSEIVDHPMENYKYGLFNHDKENGGVGGALIQGEGINPSVDGAIIYLNGGEDLQVSLSKVESNGGKIVMPKTDIGENGFMAHFLDTEGNKIALHSMN